MEEILEKLYMLYEQKMYRLAYSIVHSEEQAEDIVQEAFIKIFSHIGEIKNVDDDTTKYWILRIVKNEAIDVYRRNKRTLELNDIVKKNQSIVAYSSIENKLQQMIQKEQLQEILNKLPHSDKEILQYKHFYELSTAEIADMLNITEDGVRKRYNRARERAKKLIGGTDDER